jgi:hypothetical protein
MLGFYFFWVSICTYKYRNDSMEVMAMARSEEEDMRFFSLTNFELYKRKTEQPTISRDLTKDLLLQFNLGHA